MKINLVVFALFILSPVLGWCQTTDQAVHNAFMITRMVNKFHVEPRPLDKAFSADIFNGMLSHTDDDKLFFLDSDIARLNPYKSSLNNEIMHSGTAYLNLFTSIYRHRLIEADSLLNVISKQSFDLTQPGRFTVAEQAAYPVTIAAKQQKWYKKIKADMLSRLVDELPAKFGSMPLSTQKRYTDSASAALSRQIVLSYRRKIDRVLKRPGGLPLYIGNIYCEVIASAFDPHTEFFPPEDKENFDGLINRQRYQFGFTVKEGVHGGVFIETLQPGSPAYKGGKLNRGDRFMSVQWENRENVDVSDFSEEELGQVLDESNHLKAWFTVKKTNGETVKVLLQKEQVANTDDEKVKSFILAGTQKVGYIYLPAFYTDWLPDGTGLNGCANDVGREIIKLKKENISALILDLRYNGGGSVNEATELAGVFIDAGPVAQEKDHDGKTVVWKDVNRGTIYDGPLVIMVNGYTASAAEMVAGTLQDYNRAVIVGSPTFGKATAQVVLPMDTTVTPETFLTKKTANYIKITMSRLYRVTGATAQVNGVQPDIMLPDMLENLGQKESSEPNALKAAPIAANKYYTPYPPLALKEVASATAAHIDSSRYFRNIKVFNSYSKSEQGIHDMLLNLKEGIAKRENMEKLIDTGAFAVKPSANFKITNSSYTAEQLKTDPFMTELNYEFGNQLVKDPYIDIAYQVALKIKPQ